MLVEQQVSFAPPVSEHYVHNVVKIQTPQGLAMMGNIALSWRPDTDELIVHRLHIIRGDKEIDVECGRNAGVRTIRVQTGFQHDTKCSTADWVAGDFAAAAEIILTQT